MENKDVEKLENELKEIKAAYDLANKYIIEFGGPKSITRSFYLRTRIYRLEKKIEDLKLNKDRTDEKCKEELIVEEMMTKLESSLAEGN